MNNGNAAYQIAGEIKIREQAEVAQSAK